MKGFSPYVTALSRGWVVGLTIVWCYECSALTSVADDVLNRTLRCSRIDCRADLLNQAGHLTTLKSEKDEDTDSA